MATPRTPSVPNFSIAGACQTRRADVARRRRRYRFEYCGALRAFLRPYFLDSFSRASRVRKPAFLSGGAQLGVELDERPGDAEAQGAGLAGGAAAVEGGVDVVGLGELGERAAAR